MSAPHSNEDLGQLLETLRSTIRQNMARSASEPVTGTGTAADGMIEVTAVTGGQIERIDLDPRVMRLPSETLAEELRDAVNEALRSLQASAPANSTLPIDPNALSAQLEKLQETSVRQMSGFIEAITQAQNRLSARRDETR
ncbi:YbaB/EbfC family nucleoid-associated protein [Micromonospora sp. WMMD812]|uniref:YbaB/EbfC family nucleoid-associated protein n=1 Tax=Micromonospora sp. WMMD812 TaxID=3015152 RepID=UPI00248C3B7B|nr:YbaB/EbfC family nucleoid-associated protein [Micromonospora sp. WMMD812]WBB70073.1 YbaB/EbfC family nucleoid-associated protein [Micromonospora sp. WMMD812]